MQGLQAALRGVHAPGDHLTFPYDRERSPFVERFMSLSLPQSIGAASR